MSFKEKFSNHAVPFGLSLIIVGFVSGYAVYPQMNSGKSNNGKTHVVTNNKIGCKKLKSFIDLKQSEIAQKEEQVAIASPLMVNTEIDPNSLYFRRLKELEALKEQINTANLSYVQCISGI